MHDRLQSRLRFGHPKNVISECCPVELATLDEPVAKLRGHFRERLRVLGDRFRMEIRIYMKESVGAK